MSSEGLVMRKKGLEPHLLGGCGWSREAKGEGAKAPHKGSFLASGGTNWKGPEWGGAGAPCAMWRSRLAEDGVGLPPMERPL